MLCALFLDKVPVRCPYGIYHYLYDNKHRVSIILWLLGGYHISSATKWTSVEMAPLLLCDHQEAIKKNYSA